MKNPNVAAGLSSYCRLRSAGLRIQLHKYISFQSGLINASDLFWGCSACTNLKVRLSCFAFTAKLDKNWCICCLWIERVLNAINVQIKWMFILPASLGRTFRLINERILFLFLCAPIHCKLLNGLKLTPDSTIRDFCWDNFHRGPLKMFWCGFCCETGSSYGCALSDRSAAKLYVGKKGFNFNYRRTFRSLREEK